MLDTSLMSKPVVRKQLRYLRALYRGDAIRQHSCFNVVRFRLVDNILKVGHDGQFELYTELKNQSGFDQVGFQAAIDYVDSRISNITALFCGTNPLFQKLKRLTDSVFADLP